MAVAMLAVAGLLAMTLTPAQAADYDAIMQTIVSKSSQTYTEQLKQSQMMYPHYSDATNKDWEWVDAKSWVSGFFTGQLWYLTDYAKSTGNTRLGKQITDVLRGHEITPAALAQTTHSDTHDVGFKTLLPFGMGYQRTNNATDKQALLNGAASLATRFDPRVGMTKSWDHSTWQPFPVITDNLMNLELFFYVDQMFGVNKYKQMALSHLDRTAKDLIRPNGCAWHRANYDDTTGKLLEVSGTPQGLDNPNTVWSRGQAWVIYGYTMAYRYTKNKTYLDIAHLAAKCFMDKLKEDGITDYVPPFDFAATGSDAKYLDSSATAIVASAFAELSKWGNADGVDFGKTADLMVRSLYDKYRAPANRPFILLHGESHFQQQVHDRALSYGDFYFTEAVMRLAGKALYL